MFLAQFKQALRALRRAPGFSLAVVFTLTLGIGLHSAMLTVFDRLVARPLPLRDLDRLVAIYDADTELGWTKNVVSPGNFLDFQRRTTQLEVMAAYQDRNLILSGEGEALRVPGTRISSTFFQALGVNLLLGRPFTAAEDSEAGPRVALLSHSLWLSRFGGDPGIVGRTLPLDGIPHEIVGILPPTLRLESLLTGQIFVPLRLDAREAQNRGHNLRVLGRLRPSATVASADADQKRIARELAVEYPATNRNGSATVTPLLEEANGDTKDLGLVLLSLSTFLLLIACANASNLMLARGLQRQHDLAIRAALGAARRTLVLSMLAEASLLGLVGALGGLLAGHGLLALVRHTFPAIPLLQTAGTDGWTVGFALVTTLLAVGLTSLVPVWRLSSVAPTEVLKEGQKGSGGLRQRRLQSALLVVQVTVSMVLLTGSGLMLRSLAKLKDVQTGFQADNLLTASLALPRGKYPDAAASLAFVSRLRERLRDLPGTRSVGIASFLLLGSSGNNQYIWPVGSSKLLGDQNITWTHQVSPDFFTTAGIPLLQGEVTPNPSPDTCVVNETFVRRHGLGNAAVGRLLEVVRAPDGTSRPYRIVGVVGDVRNLGLAEGFKPQVYSFLVPGATRSQVAFTVYLKAQGNPWSLASTLRSAVREVDPEVAVSRLQTMDEAIEGSLQNRSATTTLFLQFGGLGLVLAGVGFYGLVAYLVAQRKREFGIRAALGATSRRIVREVLQYSLAVTGVGLCLGALASLALGRFLASQLFRVSASDPVSLVLSALVLCGVALGAAILPALRAARINPILALRNE